MTVSEHERLGAAWNSPATDEFEAAPIIGQRQRRAKRIAFIQQALVLLAVALLAVLIARNTVINLQARGLASGFDFLWQEAGFKIAFALIPVDATSTYGRVFVAGLLNSLLIAALGIIAATLLGFLLGIARVSPSPPLRFLTRGYVELVRNLPLLLHLLLWQAVILRSLPTVKDAIGLGGIAFLSNRGLYLPMPLLGNQAGLLMSALAAAAAMTAIAWMLRRRARSQSEAPPSLAKGLSAGSLLLLLLMLIGLDWQVPQLSGFDYRGGLKLMPEFVSLIAALTLYNAAFIAEIVRAGIQAVDKGQREAASALGLSGRQILRLVIVPQALRVIVPPIANQYTHIIKASSLATVVGFPDLVNVFLGTSLNQTGRAVEIVAMTAAVYLVLCAAVALATEAFNRRVALVER
jgi:general L-amino acid transport system permease protein